MNRFLGALGGNTATSCTLDWSMPGGIFLFLWGIYTELPHHHHCLLVRFSPTHGEPHIVLCLALLWQASWRKRPAWFQPGGPRVPQSLSGALCPGGWSGIGSFFSEGDQVYTLCTFLHASLLCAHFFYALVVMFCECVSLHHGSYERCKLPLHTFYVTLTGFLPPLACDRTVKREAADW